MHAPSQMLSSYHCVMLIIYKIRKLVGCIYPKMVFLYIQNVQPSFNSQESSVVGEGIVSSSPRDQGGFFVEFLPSDIEREPSPIYKSNPTSQPSCKKLKVSSHLNSHPPLTKPKLSLNSTSQPSLKKPKVSSNPTSQPPLKKPKVSSNPTSQPSLKKSKVSSNPTSQPPLKKPNVSSNFSSPKTTKSIPQTATTIDSSPQTSQRRNIAAKNLILTRREKKRQAVTTGPVTCTVIDVETLSPKTTEKKWIDNSLYSLSALDRHTLLSIVGWLNDNLVSAAQTLLKKQSQVPGLQCTALGCTMAFNIQCGEFVQVLHDGHEHWLTVSRVGATEEILVYDSMYQSIGTFTKKQIAAILASQQQQVVVKMMNVQRQTGGYDCGLFAIAFATAIVNGIHPTELTFKQDSMRKHLYECLNKGELTMFPLVRRSRRSHVKSFVFIQLYCTCRMPELRGEMLECSGCKQWYHVDCVSVPKVALEDSKIPWFCPQCQDN